MSFSNQKKRVAVLLACIALCATAPAGVLAAHSSMRHRGVVAGESATTARINAWTVGLAGGQLEGAPIRLTAEIARVVDDGDQLHVLPIVTRGPTENVESLLYLRGVDAAIINSDVLDQFKDRVPGIRNRMSYILNLFPAEVHVFVRPEIKSIEDLKGKKVNFNTEGTAAAYSGPLIFSRLGIQVDKTFIPHQVALEQMKKGDMAAVVFVTSKPIDAFLKGRFGAGFKFLPIPYDDRVADYYMPASLTSSDYPGLIADNDKISTLAVPMVLVAFNWAPNTDRYRRITRFVDRLFDHIDHLQVAGFDPKWKSVNLAAKVPGLTRFRPAQDWLDRMDRIEQAAAADHSNNVDLALARQQIARETRLEPVDQERLLSSFLRWVAGQR